MISHIQSCQSSHEALVELCKLYESKDVVITMYLKDKLQSLKIRESNSVTKHIHLFQVILKQLVSPRRPVDDDDAILSLMHSMPYNYTFSINLEKTNGIEPTIFNYIPYSRINLDEGFWIWK
jgi:hypothetical protein